MLKETKMRFENKLLKFKKSRFWCFKW